LQVTRTEWSGHPHRLGHHLLFDDHRLSGPVPLSFFCSPLPASDRPANRNCSKSFVREFIHVFALFFRKKDIVAILAFFLFYRLAETQLLKILAPFLLDPRSKGGLGSPQKR